MEKMKQLQELLKTIILILLFIGLVFVGNEHYHLKQKENELIKAFAEDCSQPLANSSFYMMDISLLSDNAHLPESIRTKAIYECSKRIYENRK